MAIGSEFGREQIRTRDLIVVRTGAGDFRSEVVVDVGQNNVFNSSPIQKTDYGLSLLLPGTKDLEQIIGFDRRWTIRQFRRGLLNGFRFNFPDLEEEQLQEFLRVYDPHLNDSRRINLSTRQLFTPSSNPRFALFPH